ncbi:MAG: glycosyltransferase [archaeon]
MITFGSIILWGVYFISLYFVVFWLLVFFEQKTLDSPKRKLKNFPTVSVVIPAFNEEKTIESTILSALNLNYPKNKLEILVINDGSSDSTKSKVMAIQRRYPQVILINQKNKGKGAAMNNALRHSKGEFFVCLDADSEVEKDALIYLLPNFFEEKVACVLPLMKAKNPKNLLEKLQFTEYIVNIFYKKLMGFLHSIPVAPGPFSIFRRQILVDIGGYDENNLTEDLEITLRLQSLHYKIIQDMHAEVYTKTPRNVRAFIRQRKRWFKGGFFNGLRYRRIFFNPKYGDFGIIQAPMLVLSGVIAISLLVTVAYNIFKPYIRGFFNLKLVNFDFWTFIENLKFSFNILDMNFTNVFVFIVMFSISIFVLYLSYKSTREKVSDYGKIHIVLFLFFYFLMLGLSWILLLPELFYKKHKW